MTKSIMLAALVSVASIAPAHAKGGVQLSNTVLVQQKSAAADGTTRVSLVPAKRVVPGDRVVFRMAYKNEAGGPVTGMVVSNPVPANLSYRGPAEGSPAPEVSTDGIHFAPLSSLTLAGRPVQPDQVRAVRWLVKGAVPAGASGQYSFEATIK
jgi:uncharacterized repeat protein (TIGR01451 family)